MSIPKCGAMCIFPANIDIKCLHEGRGVELTNWKKEKRIMNKETLKFNSESAFFWTFSYFTRHVPVLTYSFATHSKGCIFSLTLLVQSINLWIRKQPGLLKVNKWVSWLIKWWHLSQGSWAEDHGSCSPLNPFWSLKKKVWCVILLPKSFFFITAFAIKVK